jgi:hypothetical protein
VSRLESGPFYNYSGLEDILKRNFPDKEVRLNGNVRYLFSGKEMTEQPVWSKSITCDYCAALRFRSKLVASSPTYCPVMDQDSVRKCRGRVNQGSELVTPVAGKTLKLAIFIF